MRRARVAMVAVALMLIGCKDERAAGSGAPPARSSVGSAAPSALPSASNEAIPPRPKGAGIEDGIIVVISKKTILVGEVAEPIVRLRARAELAKSGIDARHKRQGAADLFIVPLAEQLKKEVAKLPDAGKTPSAIVIADPGTPYRVVVEVLYTLGQSGVGRYHLQVLKREPPAAAPPVIHAPTMDLGKLPPAADGGSLQLAVLVTAEGITLRTNKGSLTQGCGAVGSGVTVPNVDHKYDLAAVKGCAAKLKRQQPADTSVTISADPAIRYDVIIALIDALRGESAPLFPDVHFALPR